MFLYSKKLNENGVITATTTNTFRFINEISGDENYDGYYVIH